MVIVEILAFLALVAIIFGVSMHEAFWGIIIFIIGIVVFVAAVLLLGYGLLLAGDKAKHLLRPSEQEKQRRKKSLHSEVEGAILLIWLFSPWVFVLVLSTAFKEFSDKNAWVMYFAFLPYVVPICAYIITSIILKIKKLRKPSKRAKRG